MSAVELSLTDIMSKMVVDDWGQCKSGKFGSLRAHVEAGKLSEDTLHAELGQIVAGLKPGREREDETILFWHRGLSPVGHRPRRRHAGQGGRARDRPAPSLRVTDLVANARMYAVTPRVEEAWRALFEAVGEHVAVPIRYRPHPAPCAAR
jgi:hypothetical protein